MKFKPFDGLNPALAYRERGSRYGLYVFTKTAVLGINVLLAVVSLLAGFADPWVFAIYECAAKIMLKIAGAAVPFLLFESVYWWYRIKRERAANIEQSDAAIAQ